jgi:hypothetical protein
MDNQISERVLTWNRFKRGGVTVDTPSVYRLTDQNFQFTLTMPLRGAP